MDKPGLMKRSYSIPIHFWLCPLIDSAMGMILILRMLFLKLFSGMAVFWAIS